MNETSMAGKHPRLADVRLMERLNLTDRRWPPHACDDMLNPVSTAELRELRHASSCRIELGASIRQDLIRLPIFLHGFFQKLDRMLRGWVVMNPRAWNEAAVIVQVTDHPFIRLGHLEVSLPQVVTVRSLESALAPNLSRRFDWIVQSSLDEYSMDSVVTNRDYAFTAVVLEVAFNLAWTPTPFPSKLEYELHRFAGCLPGTVRSSGFDA